MMQDFLANIGLFVIYSLIIIIIKTIYDYFYYKRP